MISRFGHPVHVAWPEHHLIMVEAAITLPHRARQEAFKDIAELTTRSLDAVRRRAYEIKRQAERQALSAERKRVMRMPAHWTLPPSELRKPSLAKLMGCR